MDGYTNSAYRQIVKEIAPKTICFSEFYSADGISHSKDLAKKVLSFSEIEQPLIIQIFGKNPENFEKAAKILADGGIAGIDVNMGCPAKKVVRSGHGSSLMIDRETAFRIIEVMAKAVSIPISVKTRLGWSNSEDLIEFCQGLENAGASLITVHGRTFAQAFEGTADWNPIYELKKHLSVPVIGNGDIENYADGTAKMKNLDGFMIGRGSFGNPWCFSQNPKKPNTEEVLKTTLHHAELLVDTLGPIKGIYESRKHLVQYLKGFSQAKAFRARIVRVESIPELEQILQDVRTEIKNAPTL